MPLFIVASDIVDSSSLEAFGDGATSLSTMGEAGFSKMTWAHFYCVPARHVCFERAASVPTQ
jgi:hypothetical protein